MLNEGQEIYVENGEIKSIDEFTEVENGKVIYEVLRIINGKPLFYEEHYDRMKNSFRLNGAEIIISKEKLNEFISKVVKNNNRTIGNIKVTYNMSSKMLKVFFIKHSYPTDDMYKNGVKTILYFGERENPNAKVVNSDFREKVNEEIRKSESYEGILVDRNGYITEGSRSNIFMIKDNTIYTSKVEAVLPGVTRMEIMKVAKANGIKVIEENISYKKIEEFDSMFISGTSPNILPISYVGKVKFSVNNILLRELMSKFALHILADV